MIPLRQYSRQTDLEIQKVLRRERQTNALGTTGDAGPPALPPERHIRWAKTSYTAACDPYPATGNVLPIILGDYTFDDTTCGTQTATFTAYVPQEERIAYFPGYVAEGVVVRVSLHDHKWWAMDENCLVHVNTGPSTGYPSVEPLWTSGGIAANSSVMGSNYCELWESDPTTGAVTQALDGSGNVKPITVWNKSSTSIDPDVALACMRDCSGLLVAIWQDCF